MVRIGRFLLARSTYEKKDSSLLHDCIGKFFVANLVHQISQDLSIILPSWILLWYELGCRVISRKGIQRTKQKDFSSLIFLHFFFVL